MLFLDVVTSASEIRMPLCIGETTHVLNFDVYLSIYVQSSFSLKILSKIQYFSGFNRYQVSKVVWDLLITKCMELRHLKHKYGPFGSKKSSGRYRPYSNVDSFLKVIHHFRMNPHKFFDALQYDLISGIIIHTIS